jgi:hypothetical protein
LQAALDAIAIESLRRSGTSIEELRTGFSKAATSAINDVEDLVKTHGSSVHGPAPTDATD